MTEWSEKQTTLTMRVAELMRENERLHKQHEAFRQEVSDAVKSYVVTENYLGKFNDTIGRFIITETDTKNTSDAELEAVKAENGRLREEMIRQGMHKTAPCVVCGYNGPGYYQPDQHGCVRVAEASKFACDLLNFGQGFMRSDGTHVPLEEVYMTSKEADTIRKANEAPSNARAALGDTK